MSNKYLDFISDEDLFECIEFLHSKYMEVSRKMTLDKFYKNKLDPIKFSFDIGFKGITPKQKIIEEIYRQQDKSISNHIGKFHELLISKIDGFQLSNSGHDIENHNKTIFAEIKNKYNTIKGEDKKSIHKKMQEIADKYPNAICYVVYIIGKDSYNRIWEFTSGKGENKKFYKHDRVKEITADKFYSLITGKEDAFYNLCKIIPKAIEDYINLKSIDIKEVNVNEFKIYENIKLKSNKKGLDVIDEIYEETFSDYLIFNETIHNKEPMDKNNVIFNKKYTVLDLFSGAGGLSLGLEEAGFKSIGLVERDKYAANTLRINRPEWNVIQGDVVEIAEKGIRNYIDNDVEVDLLSGGYPCQAFSYAGEKLGLEYIRGTMFYYYAKILKELMPKVFLVESVRGLVSHNNGNTLKIMIDVFNEIGYNVKYEILKATDYGVAQKRERIIIVGTRKDLDNIDFKFPKPFGYIPTLRDALKDVPESEGLKYPEKEKKILDLVPPGGCWIDLPEDIAKEYMGKSYYSGRGRLGMLRRMSWDEPCLALIYSPAQKQIERCHPDETRPFTTRECARIQSFPDEWKFEGSVNQVYRQICNSVPVKLGKAVGISIIDYLDKVEISKLK